MELTEGAVVADRFRLVKQLGQGAMGTVWKAHHTGLDIPCAVKFIRPEVASSPELRARFGREAKSAAQLRSPHVVQILDHGEWEGQPYMAMELLEGEELEARLARVGRIPPADVAEIVQQISRALGKAHQMGLIHRDLKPSNIYLSPDGDHELAKILDFGIVKDTSRDTHTRAGAMMGTPYYMSPEQAKSSKTIDHRADLWSLGVVVYRSVTGQLPFTAQSMGDLLMKILSEPLPVPSQVASVPAGFDAWWTRAASRDPAQRFQSAKELADALSALVAPAAAATMVSATAPQASAPVAPSQMASPAGPMSQQGPYSAPPATPYSAPPAVAYPAGPPSAAYPPASAYGAPPPSVMMPAKKATGNWWIYALVGGLVLFVVLVAASRSRGGGGPNTAPLGVNVMCTPSAEGADCTVDNMAGTMSGNACWDVKVACQNGINVKGFGCQTVEAGSKSSMKVLNSKFEIPGAQRCDKPTKVTVENVTLGPKR